MSQSYDVADHAGNCWMPGGWRLSREPGDEGFRAYVACLQKVSPEPTFAHSRRCAEAADASSRP